MELKTRDIYRVECTDALSADSIASLFSLYQPLTGTRAAALYLTLYSEGRTQHTQESHGRLCAIMNCSIEELERSRVQLEQYLLLRVYMQEGEQKNSYVYKLNPPLSTAGFLSSGEFMAELVQNIGKKEADLTAAKLSAGRLNTSGYQEVTRQVSQRRLREYDLSEPTSHMEPRYSFSDDAGILFDYEHFIATTSVLVFPAELRTQENMSLIGRLATVYGLSADRMRVLVSKSVNLGSMTFDQEQLKLLAEKSTPDVTKAKDAYALPPVSFLQARQNGAPVSLSDRKILENLLVNYHFPPEVINIMIEYILRISQNRLVKSFVEMVAGEWARDQVDSRDKAFAETRKKLASYRAQAEEVLPAYLDKGKAEPVKPQEETGEEDRRAIAELMKKMEGRK
jgi:replication initiation and membrane attachment protein DnaB